MADPIIATGGLGAPVAAWAATAGAAGLLATVDPAGRGLFPPCPFRLLTGLYCPGCGSLRGLHQLLNGKLGVAFGLNPLMMVALPFVLTGLVVWTGQRLGLLENRTLQLPRPVPWAVLAVVIAFGILRNVPAAPFSALAP